MNRTVYVDTRQLLMVLFLSRIFTALTFTPQGDERIAGSTVMLGQLLSCLLQLLLLVPAWLLYRDHPRASVLDCANTLNRPLGGILAVLYGAFFLVNAVYTAASFDFFLTTAIYPNSSSWLPLILLVGVAWYGAHVGIEPLSRVAGFLFVGVLLSGVFIALALIPRYDLSNWVSPLYDGVEPVWRAAWGSLTRSTELAAVLLLVPMVKGNLRSGVLWWQGITLVAFEAIGLGTLLALGEYAGTRLFPVYTLSTIAEFSIFQRMDALHMAVWVFLAALKTGLYLFLAAFCLRDILPQGQKKFALPFCAVLLLVGSIWLARQGGLLVGLTSPFGGVVPLLLLVAVCPLLLWLWERLRGRREVHHGA